MARINRNVPLKTPGAPSLLGRIAGSSFVFLVRSGCPCLGSKDQTSLLACTSQSGMRVPAMSGAGIIGRYRTDQCSNRGGSNLDKTTAAACQLAGRYSGLASRHLYRLPWCMRQH